MDVSACVLCTYLYISAPWRWWSCPGMRSPPQISYQCPDGNDDNRIVREHFSVNRYFSNCPTALSYPPAFHNTAPRPPPFRSYATTNSVSCAGIDPRKHKTIWNVVENHRCVHLVRPCLKLHWKRFLIVILHRSVGCIAFVAVKTYKYEEANKKVRLCCRCCWRLIPFSC